jgi:hypothetical protein
MIDCYVETVEALTSVTFFWRLKVICHLPRQLKEIISTQPRAGLTCSSLHSWEVSVFTWFVLTPSPQHTGLPSARPFLFGGPELEFCASILHHCTLKNLLSATLCLPGFSPAHSQGTSSLLFPSRS